jgi:hypothetical protein
MMLCTMIFKISAMGYSLFSLILPYPLPLGLGKRLYTHPQAKYLVTGNVMLISGIQ